jgi:hypothetical protein
MEDAKISLKEVSQCLARIKRNVGFNEDSEIPITLAYSHLNKDWAIQTGDNSYMGPAYSYPHWGVSSLYPGCNCKKIAKDLVSQINDLI